MTVDFTKQTKEMLAKLSGLNQEQMTKYIFSHPHYVPALAACLEWHMHRHHPFKWTEVRVFPRDLNRLVMDGLLTKEGNKGYSVTKPEELRIALMTYYREVARMQDEMKRYNSGATGKMPLPPGVPENIFDDIVGYDQVKREIILALNAQSNIHVLLYGPPSTAKSLFLEGLKSLPGARLTFGDAVSKAGLRRFVMEEKPQYLIIDEIDKMSPEDDTILLELMEHQTVSVMHYDQNEMEDISLRVFAAANNLKKMRPELLSRFHKIQLREYTQEEFIRVAYNHLTQRLNTPPAIAEYIAKGVAYKTKDIRDAVRIANMSRTIQDAAFLVSRIGEEANV